jgi:PTS system mannose-specific IID component
MTGERATPVLPLRTRLAMMMRLLAIQGSWNYETLMGNGIGFCVEPALRLLPGGAHTPEFKRALARQSKYFNAHPYLASVAVGALARAELDHEPPERIERFRTALCGPLGSVGDRLVWAGWLPFCSLVALAAFGVGAGPLVVLSIFLGLYNTGHLALRLWGLNVGWTQGLRVASALGHPVFRTGPTQIGRLAALATGLGLPLAIGRLVTRESRTDIGLSSLDLLVIVGVVVGALVIIRLQNRIEGWRLSLVVLASLVLYSVIR